LPALCKRGSLPRERSVAAACARKLRDAEYFGAFHSRHRSRNLRRLSRIRQRLAFLPFDERAAIEYGRIRQETHSRGTPIPVADTMIAAIARPLRLRVLSHDEHFRWVPGLQVDDWLA